MNCLITYPGIESGSEICSLRKLVEVLKAHPEGLCRTPYFFEADDLNEVEQGMSAGTLPVSGPLVICHAIRRAGDIVLEGCKYEGIPIQLEVNGKRLPELPPKAELETMLADEGTLISIAGRVFKPATEVFGFQQVYDDTVKVIDALKKLGIPSETMMIFATPAEISIEVHPGVFGMSPDPKLPSIYHGLLLQLGDIKTGERLWTKTGNKTIILDSTNPDYQLLLPGSVHPGMHRAKVGVGPSHFAYGTAAFSDYCCKKRSVDDCMIEIKTWIKALETSFPAVERMNELMKNIAVKIPEHGFAASVDKSEHKIIDSGFRSLKSELDDIIHRIRNSSALVTPFSELTRSLGGGWKKNGLHVIAGPRESGKASMCLSQAVEIAADHEILYVSREHDAVEFLTRLASMKNNSPLNELLLRKNQPGKQEESLKQAYLKSLESLPGSIGDRLFFRGTDASLNVLNSEELVQLMQMLPANKERVLIVESIQMQDIRNNPLFLSNLKNAAISKKFTIILSVHTPDGINAKPHLIEESDTAILADLQHITDSVVTLVTEKVNLKKFLACSQGKLDPLMVQKLEAHFTQLAGGKRMKTDTYAIARLIHSRCGARQMILYLYQRGSGRFIEGPAIAIGRA